MFEITEARFEDQGMITCQAENVFGTRVALVKLIVFGEFLFSFSYFDEITFIKKSLIGLLCNFVL